MSNDFSEMGQKLHEKLDSGIDRLKTARASLEDFAKGAEGTIQTKLDSAKESLEARKQQAASAMDTMEEYVKGKATETEEAVAEWKANHDRKKLEKRAERAEKHAESSIELALYYALAAQAAILEAAAARQDANGAA